MLPNSGCSYSVLIVPLEVTRSIDFQFYNYSVQGEATSTGRLYVAHAYACSTNGKLTNTGCGRCLRTC